MNEKVAATEIYGKEKLGVCSQQRHMSKKGKTFAQVFRWDVVVLPGDTGGGGLPLGGLWGRAAELVKYCLVSVGRR